MSKREIAKIAREIKSIKTKLATTKALLSAEVQKNIAGHMFGEPAISSSGAAKFHMGEAMDGGSFYVQNIARSGFNAGVLQGLALAFSALENLGVVDKNPRSSKAGKEARSLLANLEGVENYAAIYKAQREKYRTALDAINNDLMEVSEDLWAKESGGVVTFSVEELEEILDKAFSGFKNLMQ